MALWISGLLFAVFGANVVAGAYLGGPFAGDVVEMLLLAFSNLFFVVAILVREATERSRHDR